jgi:hypothetical protein
VQRESTQHFLSTVRVVQICRTKHSLTHVSQP